MTLSYRVYGLTLRANRRLPHLPRATARADDGETLDVRFDVADESVDALRFVYAGARGSLQFAVDPAGTRICASWIGDTTRSLNNAAGLLVGPVLGGVLRLRGTVSLHASVVAIDDRAVVLLGGTGAGKSTLASALAACGQAVLSDDVGALVERPAGTWVAEPGYPRLRLDPAMLGRMETPDAPAADAGPVLTSSDKRYLELSDGDGSRAWRFQATPLPVAAIYELHRGRDATPPRVRPVAGAERLTTLMRRLRAAPAPLARSTRSAELEQLGRLVAAVPIRRLDYPDGLDGLPAVCRVVVEDARSHRQR